MPSESGASFRSLLAKLVQTPEFFTPSDLRLAFEHVFTTVPGCEKPTSVIPEAQIGSLLTALHINRLERRPEFLAAVAALLREKAIKVDVEGRDEDWILDIVGTGGDGYNLFNVSTAAGIVVAGSGGRVIKHGSRASTSSSGSADLLQALGCSFSKGPSPSLRSLPGSFTFILAPHYHPTLALLGPIRKLLPFRTMFNVTGPLINPAFPHAMLLGVAESGVGAAFARSLREGGVRHAWVVCGGEGAEGLDEISCAGPTRVWEVRDDNNQSGDDVIERVVTPEDFGLKRHPLYRVVGGTPEENAAVFKRLFNGEGIPEDLEPLADFVCLNAGALLLIAGMAKDEKEAAQMARQSLISGAAWQAFLDFRQRSQ